MKYGGAERGHNEHASRAAGRRQASRPWQCLYFLPDPQGHGSLRPTFSPARTNGGAAGDGRSPPSPLGASASLVVRVLVLHVADRGLGLDRLDVCLGAHLHRQHDPDDVLLDAVEHVEKSSNASRLYSCFGFFCA